MPSRNGRFNIELLLGVSATFLSLAALIVSIFQTKIAREQQQASVWPRLMLGTSVEEKVFNFSLINQGVGPAIVSKAETAYKGKKYSSHFTPLFEELGRPVNGGWFTESLEPETVLKSGDKLDLFVALKGEALASTFFK